MASKNKVELTFAGDADQLQKESRKAAGAVDDFGRKVKRANDDIDRHSRGMGASFDRLKGWAAGAGAAIAGAFAFDKVLDAARASIDAFLESERTQFRMDFQFDQAGLGAFKEQFKEFNEQLAKITPFDDDAFAGAESVLARAFGTPDEIRRYTRLAADLSAVTGRDLASSAEALVKASAGSTRILKDFGIRLDDLADEGEDASVIFDALERKVGGAAEKLGTTYGGQLDIAKNRLGEIAEEIGSKLAPVLVDGTEKLATFAEGAMVMAEDLGQAFDDAGIDTSELQDSLRGLSDYMAGDAANKWADFKGWITQNSDAINDFSDDLAFLVDKVGPLVSGWVDFQIGQLKAFAGNVMWVTDKVTDLIKILSGPNITGHKVGISNTAVGTTNFTGAGGSVGPKSSFHDGGIVDAGGVGREGIALVEHGERITPAASGGDMTVNLVLDGRVLASMLINPLSGEIRNRGGSVQAVLGR